MTSSIHLTSNPILSTMIKPFKISGLSTLYVPHQLIKPKCLHIGDTIGLFTPSWPGNVFLEQKYQHALNEMQRIGFNFIEGHLTAAHSAQGYRSASPEERAAEFMDLIRNRHVRCIMATIGGSNSSSLIPFLDFEEIRRSQKIICGYSDITSLHLAIMRYSGLSTFYGPAVIPSFGEAPHMLEYSLQSFLDRSCNIAQQRQKIEPSPTWSNHFIDASQAGWDQIPRTFSPNPPWQVLSPGFASGPLVVADLETLLTAAGTPHFPVLKECILCVEEMFAPFSKEERNFRQLDLMGIFNEIAGLVISKPHSPDPQGAPFSYDALISEVVGKRPYPIISNFDCGHTFPMITLSQGLKVSLKADAQGATFHIEESAVEP